MKQLIQVLDALHLREIVHCNIKRENVLYSDGKLTMSMRWRCATVLILTTVRSAGAPAGA